VTIHIAGLDVQVGPLVRQLCAWCGETIENRDLSKEKVAVQPGHPIPETRSGWPIGALIEITTSPTGGGRIVSIVDHDPAVKLPIDCCAMDEPEATDLLDHPDLATLDGDLDETHARIADRNNDDERGLYGGGPAS